MRTYCLDYNPEIFLVHPNILKFEKEIRNYTPAIGEDIAFFLISGDLVEEMEAEYNDKMELEAQFGDENDGIRKGCILTHNHPSDTSFSKPDLMTAASIQLSEIRVVGLSGLYSMKPNENGWPKPEEIDVCFDRIEKSSEMNSKLNDIEFSGELDVPPYYILDTMRRIKSDLICEILASELEMIYTKSCWNK